MPRVRGQSGCDGDTLKPSHPLIVKDLFGTSDEALGDFTDWTFRLRIRPVGPAADDAFPVPHLSLGSTLREGEGDAAPAPWLPPVAPEPQDDGSFLYTVKLPKADGSAFDPASIRTHRLEYPPLHWREPDGYAPEFAVFDPQLTDPDGNAYRVSIAWAAGSAPNTPPGRYMEIGVRERATRTDDDGDPRFRKP